MKFGKNKKRFFRSFFCLISFALSLSCSEPNKMDESYYSLSDERQAPLETWDGSCNIMWYLSDRNGTVYNIYSANELAGIAYLVNTGKESFFGKKINLKSDVYLNEIDNFDAWPNSRPKNTWEPIGICNSRWDEKRSFKGHFNASNHTISGMFIDDSVFLNPIFDSDAIGFFGSVKTSYADGVFCSDLILSDSLISLSGTMTSYVGSIAGTAFGGGLFGYKNGICNIISRCSIQIEQRIEMLGGLIGLCAVNCFNSCFCGTFRTPLQTKNFGGLTCGGSYPHFLLNCFLLSDISFVDRYRLSGNGALTCDGIPLYCSFFSTDTVNSRIYGVGKNRKNETDDKFWPSGNYKFSSFSSPIFVPKAATFVADDVFFSCDNRRDAKYPHFVETDFTLMDALDNFSLLEAFGIECTGFFRKWIFTSDENNYPVLGEYR